VATIDLAVNRYGRVTYVSLKTTQLTCQFGELHNKQGQHYSH